MKYFKQSLEKSLYIIGVTIINPGTIIHSNTTFQLYLKRLTNKKDFVHRYFTMNKMYRSESKV